MMKRIGIFTKMDMAGGSEFRAVELANGVAKVSGYVSVLLLERGIAERLRPLIHDGVEVHTHIFQQADHAAIYSLFHLLVINTDSRSFTSPEFWSERSEAHPHPLDLAQVRSMSFLFNFIVSPACKLPELAKCTPDIRIITANTRFFNEISQQERYRAVRHYPRLMLESPINPDVRRPKRESEQLRFGMHSLPVKSKWNEAWPQLVEQVNKAGGDRVSWDFMGMPENLQRGIRAANVTFRREFSSPVGTYLRGVDCFVFFPQWTREETWARVVGEALTSGSPVVTNNKGGNPEQVVHGNTGYICRNNEEYKASCLEVIANTTAVSSLGGNAMEAARLFRPRNVVRKFLQFVS